MFGKKESVFGLDIGSHMIKVVQLDVKSATPVLANLGMIPIPRDAFAEGRVSKPELIAGAVQQLLTNLKIKSRQVAASISGYEVMIKKIDLPTMSEEELDNRMQTELGQYIPYNIEEVGVDYQILGMSKDRASHMEVLLVAAKKESINDFLGLLKLCGLDPAVLDVDFFALENAFEAAHGTDQESVALIDIGAQKAVMNIVSNSIPVFTRGISIGGGQINDRLFDHLGLSSEDAERVKLGEIPGHIDVRQVEEVFVSVVRSWVNECKRAIDFYYSNYPDNRISKIFLSGGSCRIPGLDKVLEEYTEIPVEVFNPFSRVEYDPKAIDPAYVDYAGPQMAISMGLALRKSRTR